MTTLYALWYLPSPVILCDVWYRRRVRCFQGEVLRKCTRLTHLILKDTELDNGGIAQLQSSLSVCTNIQHLDLSCGRLTPFGAAKLAQVFESWSVNLQFVTSVFTALQSSDRRSC